jgi:preprotein translocase subunit SecB
MKKPPLDPKAASRLAPNMRLNDVSYLWLSVGYASDEPEESDLPLSWAVAPIVASWLRSDQTIIAVFPFEVSIDGKSEAGTSTRIADVAVGLRVEYTIVPGVDLADADIDDFVGVNGYIQLWPYLRAEVQNLTTKVGLPPLVLPVQLSGHAARAVSVAREAELSTEEVLVPPSDG